MREAVGSRASRQTLDEIIFSFVCRLCLYHTFVSHRLFAVSSFRSLGTLLSKISVVVLLALC